MRKEKQQVIILPAANRKMKNYNESGVTRAWKIYGRDGHRQRESFCKSYSYDWSVGPEIRKLEIFNSDSTGTNEYTIVRITRNTSEECFDELEGQISDGIFENSATGNVIEIDLKESEVKKFYANQMSD